MLQSHNCNDFYFSYPKNFDEGEIKKIVEDCIINRMNQKDLCSKYETSMDQVRDILRKAGFTHIPKNWVASELPIYVKNLSHEEYYKKIQWCIKIKMRMPKDLSQYPDFPEKLESMSYEEHYNAIENFWKIHEAISGED